ncbi:MAG TPA: DUF2752 domain-containing protein [Acidobacteriaceae bacterium]
MSGDSTLFKRRVIAHATLAGVLLACCALVVVPPSRFAFYPHCPIHEYLGLLCPGCGATRALVALLHGHLAQALRLNLLFVLLLPFALAAAMRVYLRAIGPGDFRWPRIPNPALAAALLTTAVVTIARNAHMLSF